MTSMLVLYGTTEGQTEKIARFVAHELRLVGASADLVEVDHGNPSPRDYDAIVVAASVHVGGYQHGVERWVKDHVADLHGRPTLFLSVCLGVLQPEAKPRRELAAIVQKFLAKTGWSPGEVQHVAGALRYTRYGWLKKLVMRRIAAKAGGATDTTRDHEYTDWQALRALTHRFHAKCRERDVVYTI